MEAKITANGYLQIDRNGIFKAQYCPWGQDRDASAHCGDWCPLFHEYINKVSSEPYHKVFIHCGNSGLGSLPIYFITKDERIEE